MGKIDAISGRSGDRDFQRSGRRAGMTATRRKAMESD
jgi:hypothetical protein